MDDNYFVDDEWVEQAPSTRPPNEKQDADSQAAPDKAVSFLGRACGLVQFGINFITRNGQLSHKTPVPPCSDVAELEYISALHQCDSMNELKQDGSISSDEIAAFLKSRHGLKVSAEMVRTLVLQDGLTADKDENHPLDDSGGGVMDLVELTSALIIPNLLRLRRKKLDEDRLRGRSSKVERLLSSSTLSGASKTHVDEKIADNVDILRDVLSHMLEDCTGDSTPKPLDAELCRDILRGYGEGALAHDEELVEEMVAAASTGHNSEQSEDEIIKLDLDTLVEALTSDVARNYQPGRDESFSTNFQDVWSCAPPDRWDEEGGKSKVTVLHEQTLSDKVKQASQCCKKEKKTDSSDVQDDENGNAVIKRLFTGQCIDFTADNYRTRLFVSLLWIAFVAYYVAYMAHGLGGYQREQCMRNTTDTSTAADSTSNETSVDIRAAVTCPLVSGIVNQLLLITELVVFGTPFMCLGSIGNAIEGKETRRRMIVAIVCFGAFIFVPYFVPFTVPHWVSSAGSNQSLQNISLIFGLIVMSRQMLHLLMILIRKCSPGRSWYANYFTFGNIRYEAKIKRAALFKIDQMLSHAHSVHRTIIKDKSVRCEVTGEANSSQFLSNFGRALNEYFVIHSKTTYIGGVLWTWKKFFNGTLFTEEGIWISSRVVAGSIFQVLVIISSPIVVYFGFPIVEEYLDPDHDGISLRSKVAVGIGVICAFLVSIVIFSLFLPNMVCTTLKFRRGVLQPLRSDDFLHRYRFALDQVALVFPGMFWGILFSSCAIAFLTGGFIYLLLWEKTSGFLFQQIGNLLGLSIIVILKIILSQVMRFSFFAAFYRKKPLAGNLFSIVIEVYAIGISLWFMVVRVIKIIIIGALYLGRIDTPLFASGVGIFGPLEVDNWPTVTRKDILIHEAHRHPYLEQLGYLYMMQLRYRDGGFARRGCSAWRLVFVLALMPWMHKYRDMTRPDHFGEDDEEDANAADDGNAMMHALAANATHGLPNMPQVQGKKSIRYARQSMVSPRWQVGTLKQLEEICEEETEEAGTKEGSTEAILGTDKGSRIVEIEQEIERLQRELSELKSESSKSERGLLSMFSHPG